MKTRILLSSDHRQKEGVRQLWLEFDELPPKSILLKEEIFEAETTTINLTNYLPVIPA